MIIERQLRDEQQRKGLVVSQDILEKTNKCENEFSCLTNSGECLCEPEHFSSENVCFVKPDRDTLCHYMISFGYSFVCTCPTRKEIYKKYRM